jgi:hypothetical protein
VERVMPVQVEPEDRPVAVSEPQSTVAAVEIQGQCDLTVLAAVLQQGPQQMGITDQVLRVVLLPQVVVLVAEVTHPVQFLVAGVGAVIPYKVLMEWPEGAGR